MRDEDLKNLPNRIEGWQVAEMLRVLGITEYYNVHEVLIEPRKISVEVYATDESGQRYAEDKEAAIHKISIPFGGSFTKPTDARLDGISRCQSRPVGEYSALQCERGPGHSGQHVAWNGADSDVRWGSNSGESAEFVPCGTTDGHGRTCVLGRKHGGVHDFGPRRAAACGSAVPHGYHNWLEGINAKECSGLED